MITRMTTSKAQEITRKALGIAIARNRSRIIALLKKYGVAIDDSYSDDELIVGVLTALKTNNRFKKDLGDLLYETTSDAMKSFTGEEGQQFFGFVSAATLAEAAASQENTTTAPTGTQKEKTALGGLFADKNTLSSILNTGLGVLSTSLTNKGNQKLANTALAIETEKTKQAALAAGAGGNGLPGAQQGLSTGAKIAIGVGIAAVLGTIIYFVVKK